MRRRKQSFKLLRVHFKRLDWLEAMLLTIALVSILYMLWSLLIDLLHPL